MSQYPPSAVGYRTTRASALDHSPTHFLSGGNELSSKGDWSLLLSWGEKFSHRGGSRSRATTSPLQKEPVEVVWTSVWPWCLLGTSSVRRCRHVLPDEEPEVDQGHAGEIGSLAWPCNASGSPWMTLRRWLGRWRSGLCLDYCLRDPARISSRGWEDGCMDGS